MCSRFPNVLATLALLLPFVGSSFAAELRVCADPDSLPTSNRQLQGYENRIAQVVARDLHATLSYEWQRMGRGFVSNVLNRGKCDVLLGVPSNFSSVLTTEPYYRSSYVFVTRRDHHLQLQSFDAPALRKLKVGVQVLGEEYAPPGQALGRRGLFANIVVFDTPATSAASMIDAVVHRRIDTAVLWGPQAGYYARRYARQVELTPTPASDSARIPLQFSISMGVRKIDRELRDRLSAALQRNKPEIERILRSYGVPLIDNSTRGAISEPAVGSAGWNRGGAQ